MLLFLYIVFWRLLEVSYHPPFFPYILHSIKLEGYSEDTSSVDRDKIMKLKSEIADVAKLIQINKEKCIYEYNRLCRYISEVEDSQMRQILMLRYVNGTSILVAFTDGADTSPAKAFLPVTFFRTVSVT